MRTAILPPHLHGQDAGLHHCFAAGCAHHPRGVEGVPVLLRPDPEERRPAPAASSKVRHEWLQLEGQAAGARGGEPLRAGKIGARVTKKAAVLAMARATVAPAAAPRPRGRPREYFLAPFHASAPVRLPRQPPSRP